MRKALFAVVLVAASFAGGAVVNGPGLQWAQAMLLNGASGDESASGDSAPPKVAESGPTETIPSKPIPSLVVASQTGPAPADKPAAAPKADVPSSPPETPSPAPADGPAPEPKAPAPPEAIALPPEGKAPEPLDLNALADSDKPSRPVPPKDPALALANAPAPAEMPQPLEPMEVAREPEGSRPEKPPAIVPWADAPGSAPAAAVPPRPLQKSGPAGAEASKEMSTPEAVSGPAQGTLSAWSDLRRKMADLGVSRYAIEGEPGGRVRFHCLIPLAGKRAVAQQFEAEGDDELQAASAALRRVALWRATENPGP